jgi:hypothetical protein
MVYASSTTKGSRRHIMTIKRIIEQAYHRNGVSGHPAVVSLFEDEENEGVVFVATSLSPSMCSEALTPDDYMVTRYGEKEAYVEQWLRRFTTDTVVLNVERLAEGNIRFGANSWRGDVYGRELAEAWREKQLADTRYGGSYDPALEWYNDQHADPDEVAALMAENAKSIEEFLS